MAGYLRQLSNDVKIYNEEKVYKGYTLFAPHYGNIAWLIDMNGNIVHRWQMENPPRINTELLPNGNLIWLGRGKKAIKELAGGASELIEVNWEGNEVWRLDDPKMHHDFAIQENGNILILRFCDIPKKIQKNIKGGVPGTEMPDGTIVGVQVREINRAKETLWEWNNWEHFDIEKDVECPLANRLIWGYTNSVDAFPNGDVLLSIRHMNKVIRVSKKTGDIIWEWGPEHLLGHQHDGKVIENGNITIFDNGLHRKPLSPGDPNEISAFTTSRVLEVDPKTDKIVWEYIDPMHLIFTNFAGNAQRLSNGNTFFCESRTGTFYEVTYDKEIVWKYESPFIYPREKIWGWTESKMVAQAHRYGIDFEGFKNKDLDPERFEWILKERSTEKIKEEERIKGRLAKAGY